MTSQTRGEISPLPSSLWYWEKEEVEGTSAVVEF